MKRSAIVIFGPTASGKSALALDLAKEKDGMIVNADSLQVYEDLRILTACPDDDSLSRAPHHLYNFLDGGDNCTVSRYVSLLQELLAREGKLPIIVGGTGLYIKALIAGLPEMPDIPAEIRKEARALPIDEIRRFVAENDAAFPHGDEQRLRRAYEVMKASGKAYTFLRQQPPRKPVDLDIELIKLLPDREELYRRCNERFAIMLAQGAIDEVQSLLTKGYPEDATIMKAIGVQEIKQFLQESISKEKMISLATQRTRNYAKRQITWMKTQL